MMPNLIQSYTINGSIEKEQIREAALYRGVLASPYPSYLQARPSVFTPTTKMGTCEAAEGPSTCSQSTNSEWLGCAREPENEHE